VTLDWEAPESLSLPQRRRGRKEFKNNAIGCFDDMTHDSRSSSLRPLRLCGSIAR